MSVSRQKSCPMVLRAARAVARYLGFGDAEPLPALQPAEGAATTAYLVPAASHLRLVPSDHARDVPASHKWRRHAQLRAYTPPIAPDVREARRRAVRGLVAAREGAIEVAIDHFALAASCRDVDLTAVPGFWDLTRGQMMAAVDAYERVERYREAAALDAQIATIFRPSLVGYSQDPVRPRQHRRPDVASN